MTDHMTLFFSKQLDVPSIGMLLDLSDKLWLILDQFIFFISALTSSPLLGTKLFALGNVSATGCRVKLEAKTETKHR